MDLLPCRQHPKLKLWRHTLLLAFVAVTASVVYAAPKGNEEKTAIQEFLKKALKQSPQDDKDVDIQDFLASMQEDDENVETQDLQDLLGSMQEDDKEADLQDFFHQKTNTCPYARLVEENLEESKEICQSIQKDSWLNVQMFLSSSPIASDQTLNICVHSYS